MMKTLQRCGVLVLTLALLIGILPVDTILYAKAQPTKKEIDVSNKKNKRSNDHFEISDAPITKDDSA